MLGPVAQLVAGGQLAGQEAHRVKTEDPAERGKMVIGGNLSDVLENSEHLRATHRHHSTHHMLQIQVQTESSELTSLQSGTDACLSSSTMMLASRPSDCQCVDFSGPSSYLSRKNRGWLRATVLNTWRGGGGAGGACQRLFLARLYLSIVC